MTKPQIIEAIRQHNSSASEEFLALFSVEDLADYLQRLTRLKGQRGVATRAVRRPTNRFRISWNEDGHSDYSFLRPN